MKRIITTSAVALAAALTFGACAATDKNGDGYVTPNEADGDTYQDRSGNQSTLGAYTRDDTAATWNQMTPAEQQQGCDNYWALSDAEFATIMTDAGYPAADARVLLSFLATVC